MGDPARIPRIVKKLEEFWKKHPDLRLGQLIVNASCSIDPFFAADTLTEQYFDTMILLSPKPKEKK
jgi:hypothetical protein